MRYDQIDIALGCLNNASGQIVLQVKSQEYTGFVCDYAKKKLGEPLQRTRSEMIYSSGKIRLVSAHDPCGIDGYRCPVFIIDCDHDLVGWKASV